MVDGGGLVDEQLVHEDDELFDWITTHLDGGPATIAIDAPLLVPNETGRRPCEREIQAEYGRRKAGAHSSNRSLFLRRYGRIRGEDLAARLRSLGFADPWAGTERTLLEVYPHPALIEVFGLPERLLYKKGTVAQRRGGLRVLRGLLSTLATADPPLHAGAIGIPDAAPGPRLKNIEDALDARFCAWIAALWDRRGPDAFRIFGDPATGHIAVPVRSSGTRGGCCRPAPCCAPAPTPPADAPAPPRPVRS